MKHPNDGDWMPYLGFLLVAAFVKIVSSLVNSTHMLIRPLLKFVSLHISSNYLCTNLDMGSLAFSKSKPLF